MTAFRRARWHSEDQARRDDTSSWRWIAKQGAKTQLRFTHVRLARGAQCFTDCFDAWGSYVNGSLRRLIETGDNH